MGNPLIDGDVANLLYMVASVLFIMGIKGLTHPRTAVRGNLLGSCGMLIAVLATILKETSLDLPMIGAGVAIGALIGAVTALRVQMTSMPQLVAIFNGFGGIASALVAASAFYLAIQKESVSLQESIATVASAFIGALTFTGSLVAFVKLLELKIFWKVKSAFWGQKYFNLLLFIGCLWACFHVVDNPADPMGYWLLCLGAALLGFTLVSPIGGADMPVVIALLNSYSGLAATATGFVFSNNVLIVAGSLVGASGVILTTIMCKAMNRSLTNVIFGTMGPSADGPSADDVYAGKVKESSADEVAMLFDGAQRVVIVPGYGMAVAQAQHVVRDLATELEERDILVEFAVHPVAGRMPGHMNVLLAEADIDYDKLIEMDLINPTFETVDVALVIGANDVVNPVARTDPSSPIAGMPILDVDKARTVVVVKRSLSPGFAGIPNPLFAADNTYMLFGDAKKAMIELVGVLKKY
ncbi:MAG TPA: NAD(P)(+) transhydrogenase (Re/Si-specific) subunit beta [Planctomycetes bacterium]|nr:NAD(P)(+) transhydrogenase (Re/Si-specific) subunit beta [Planctomycetota bacterium]HIN80426.1 NAD(P)(+) transhydrogenase (Re/Si-specific) subunit beta [Planctomycetota bacterium]